jgi:hypothetical protein
MNLTQTVSIRYLIHKAAREAYFSEDFLYRTAAQDEITPEVLAAFGEAFYVHEGKVAFGNLVRRLKKLLSLFKQAPKLWTKFKAILGVEKLTEIPKKIKEWAKKGKKALGKVMKRIAGTFPLCMFFVSKKKMPGLTDLMARIIKASPRMKALLAKVKGNIIDPLDRMLDKYLPTLQRPLLAFIFAYCWFNVAEISWDIEGLIAGFTGSISLGELFASLPESGIGFIAAAFGLGYGALPVTFVLRIIWLVKNHYLEWIPGKGFVVKWEDMGIDSPSEVVGVF